MKCPTNFSLSQASAVETFGEMTEGCRQTEVCLDGLHFNSPS